MTDSTAKPSAPPAPLRARNTATRLVQYVLLQAVMVALCILVLQHRLPEPASRWLVTSFSLSDRGETRQVTLPAFVPPRNTMNEPAIFTGSFDWSARDQGRAWSVYLPRFTNGVVVEVNGVEILDSRRDPSANRSDRATPEIATIPASLLRDGTNEFVIELRVWVPIEGFLDQVYVGPDEDLRRFYEQRTLWFVTLPVVFAAWQGILAVILIVMWAMRRGEASYGALAAAMALGTSQAFLSSAIDQPAHPELNATLLAAAPLQSGFVLTFGILFFGRKWPRLLGPLIFLPAVILVLVGLFGDPFAIRKFFLLVGVPTLFAHLVLLALIVAWSEIRRPDVPSLLLGCGVTIVLTSLA